MGLGAFWSTFGAVGAPLGSVLALVRSRLPTRRAGNPGDSGTKQLFMVLNSFGMPCGVDFGGQNQKKWTRVLSAISGGFGVNFGFILEPTIVKTLECDFGLLLGGPGAAQNLKN